MYIFLKLFKGDIQSPIVVTRCITETLCILRNDVVKPSVHLPYFVLYLSINSIDVIAIDTAPTVTTPFSQSASNLRVIEKYSKKVGSKINSNKIIILKKNNSY